MQASALLRRARARGSARPALLLQDCGKPAADNFCRHKGWDKAVDFDGPEEVKCPDSRPECVATWVLGSQQPCTPSGYPCNTFKFIKCGKDRSELRCGFGPLHGFAESACLLPPMHTSCCQLLSAGWLVALLDQAAGEP